LKSLIIDILNSEDWGHGITIGLPRSLYMKNSLFRRTGAWQHQELATPSSPKKFLFYKEWAWQANTRATPPTLRI